METLTALFIGLAIGFFFGAFIIFYCENSAPHLEGMEDSYQPIESVCVDDFLEASKPLMKYVAENHHPHTKVIVTNNNSELLEGITSTGEFNEFIKD